MRSFIILFIIMGLVLVGCSQDKTNGNNEKNTPVVSEVSSTDNAVKASITPVVKEEA